MVMKKSEIIILGIILISFIIGIYLYPKMPEKMASHWNTKGEVDSYMSKFWGLFLMPIISSGMFVLFILIPKIDPLKANIKKFRNYYEGLIVLIIVFLFYIYLLSIFWNLGWTVSIIQFLAPALGILFFYIGILLEKVKRNWFIGIRTPWTLSNEIVWEKTHKKGAKLFKIAGILAFFGIFFPNQALFFIVVPIILFAIYMFVYSYIEYQREMLKPSKKKK